MSALDQKRHLRCTRRCPLCHKTDMILGLRHSLFHEVWNWSAPKRGFSGPAIETHLGRFLAGAAHDPGIK